MARTVQRRQSWFRLSAGLVAQAIAAGALVSGGAAAAADRKPPGQAGKQWNILVITSDEHNPKILGCAGNPVIRTPGIDRLAREGTLCTRTYAASPLCAPSRQSMMTGNYPQEHGQLSNSHVFNENLRTWAHHFKSHGYLTACIGKMHVNNEQSSFGFDYLGPDVRGKATTRSWDPRDKEAFDASPDVRLRGMVLDDPQADYDGLVVDDSVRWLKENRDRKFFLHASMVKPHWPWDAPREFYYMYDPATIDLPSIVPDHLERNYVPREKKRRLGWDRITEDMHRVYRARYYGSLSWLDSNVQRLLETLDELGLTDETLVIYTTDHGDMAGEKGLWLKGVMYDAVLRVPLVVRMPGVVPAGRTCDALLNGVDLFPTIAGLTGTTEGLPADLSGEDRSTVILGEAEGPLYTFSVAKIPVPLQLLGQIMARSRRWKLIFYPNLADGGDRYVLYDMENDPDETTNLAADPEFADVVAEHRQAIDAFLAGLKEPLYPPELVGGAKSTGGGNRYKRPAADRAPVPE